MVSIKQQNRFLLILLVACMLIISIGGLGVWWYVSNKNSSDDDKICMRHSDYTRLMIKKEMASKPSSVAVSQPSLSSSQVGNSDVRDRRVLADPLYPPLNRAESSVHNSVVQAIDAKQLYSNSRQFTDRYRLVGYLTNNDDKKDSGGNTWKLMARQKDRNRSEFYLVPSNNNYDMKIMVTDDIVKGDKLRDIYTIPKQLSFSSPLLNETPYEVTELPMNDFTNFYE